jgi:putative transposase
MTNYRRANFPGGYYFFTVITYNRRKFLTTDLARGCLHHVWQEIKSRRPFELVAVCLLPEHLHCVWKLPEDDCDFSIRWSSIKGVFSREYNKQRKSRSDSRPSLLRRRESALWQRRYWEHQIRDENDLQSHVDYIHYNPIKHNLVKNLDDWPWSTYPRYLKEGFYGGMTSTQISESADAITCAGE